MSSMSSVTLLLLFLCLSVHACKCNSRSLGIVLERSATKHSHFFDNSFLKEEASSKSETSGDRNISVRYQNDLQQSAKMEVLLSSRAQARSLLGSSRDDTDETVDSKENEFVEDTVAIGYAQPHRKPPIHNEKS